MHGSAAPASPGPIFGPEFQAEFETLLAWRRDIRRFRRDPVPQKLVDELLALTAYAPSVGNCQPARFVLVETAERRAQVAENFARANAEALSSYAGDEARAYAKLKLQGLAEAPVQIALFCDEGTTLGRGLGARSMPETRRYSAVCALHTFWLAARTHGLGLGWVSILDAVEVAATLEIPPGWSFVGYFCVGWPEAADMTPELDRLGWQKRVPPTVVRR